MSKNVWQEAQEAQEMQEAREPQENWDKDEMLEKMYIVMINGLYIRNAQACMVGSLDTASEPDAAEDGHQWLDVGGDIVLTAIPSDSAEGVYRILADRYPETDLRVFKLFECPGGHRVVEKR